MKHLWHTLALGAALAVSGCADNATSPAPGPEVVPLRVPENIAVPVIRESAAGKFEFDATGARLYVEADNPISRDENCYDVCEGGDDGGGGGGSGSYDGDGGSPSFQGPYFTEAYFVQDALVGHAEMSFILNDHASQDMTLTTSRDDGSTIGSQKFSTARVWPFPIIFVANMATDGSVPAPKCGARGQGATIHDVSAVFQGATVRRLANSQSQLMYQTKCTADAGTVGQPREEVAGPTSGGGLRICLRMDHYSSKGEYIYTETIYCYDVLNQT